MRSVAILRHDIRQAINQRIITMFTLCLTHLGKQQSGHGSFGDRMLADRPQRANGKVPQLQPPVCCDCCKHCAVAWTPCHIKHLAAAATAMKSVISDCHTLLIKGQLSAGAYKRLSVSSAKQARHNHNCPVSAATGTGAFSHCDTVQTCMLHQQQVCAHLLVAALESHQRLLPALLPHAYGPVSTAG